jgi:hypothetical protein
MRRKNGNRDDLLANCCEDHFHHWDHSLNYFDLPKATASLLLSLHPMKKNSFEQADVKATEHISLLQKLSL